MWPRRSDTLCIGLSRDRIDWQIAGHPSQSAALALAHAGLEEAMAAIESSSLPPRLSTVAVVAGSSLARHWLQTAPTGLRSMSELQEMVQSRADQLFGGDPGWVVTADWHARRPFLCAAVPRDIDKLATAMARTRRATLHLATSLSLLLARHARQLPGDGWAALHEPEALHLLYLSSARPEHLRTVTVPAGLQASALAAEVRAEVGRAAGLAGGLPESPLLILPVALDVDATQSGTALALATRLRGSSPS